MKTTLIWLGMVLVLSVYPMQSGVQVGYADKLIHAFIYAVTCLLFYSFLKTRTGRWALLLSVILAAGYGLLMEIAQGFTDHRSFSGFDALANLVGAAAAALYIRTVMLRKRPRGEDGG